ncbi:MAG: DUF393 domain-containing protein [Proteobacteria bacterium]|nr:DUF393 domain-containing protein [Pseudomonadota bacterium]
MRSDAAIEIARRLPWPWRAAFALRAVPAPVRDAAYRWVARNRFRWFGRADRCAPPTAHGGLESRHQHTPPHCSP